MCKIWTEEEVVHMQIQLAHANFNKITIIECEDGVFRDVFTINRRIRNYYEQRDARP